MDKTVHEMLTELYASGYTQQQLADIMELSQGAVHQLLKNPDRDCGYNRGKNLEMIYREKFGWI